jgi:uncharacterized protein (DUF58 family)
MSQVLHNREFQQFSHLELIAKQVVEGFITGLHKSPFHGFSVEFAEHRLYNTGESTRHIDWKIYGRTEKLFVKKYEEETNLRCQLVIDSSSSMYFPYSEKNKPGHENKITFAVHSAAAMIHLLKKQRDAFGLSIFSESVDVHTPARSSTMHSKLLFHELENILQQRELTAKKKTVAADALHQIAESIHKRSLVIIFSDMMDNSGKANEAIFSALQHLRHNKHEVILFHVNDSSKELNFEFDNRPYRFIDLETGEELRVVPNEIRQSYVEAAQKFKKELMLRCGQFNIDFIEADIKQGYRQVLLPYLLKRKKMT